MRWLGIGICAVLIGLYSGSAYAGQAEHPVKEKLAKYRKVAGKQLHKIEQDCLPGDFTGPIAPDHDAIYSNCDGRTLRGRIDAKGYGTLTDDEGNSITVQPDVRAAIGAKL